MEPRDLGSTLERGLIVEDDPVSAMLIKRMLASEGIFTDHASSGLEALELHRRNHYRLVISDWMMPEMTGVELCRRFREVNGPYTYFIVCSAKGMRDDRREAFEAGVDDFLNKPLDQDELGARLTVARRILGSEDNLQIQKQRIEESSRNLAMLNENLQVASGRFQELFSGLPVACFTFDEDGVIHEWNRNAESVFDIKAFETFMQPLWDVIRDVDDEIWTRELVEKLFAGVSVPPFDWIYIRPDGQETHLACNLILLRGHSGRPVGAICGNLDITDRKRAEQQIAAQKRELEEMNVRLNELAVTDGLTGLWNRRKFQEVLEENIERHYRDGLAFSLVLMDIDFFKKYNDEFGHLVGDDVLRNFAAVLRESARAHELPARYGGEEFAMILEHCDADAAIKVAERIRTSVLDRVWENKPVTCSLGISTFRPGMNSQKMIEEADEALYFSKQHGRNRTSHYDQIGAFRAA